MGRSLRAIAGLLEDNGNVKEAEATYRKAIGRLVALGPEIAKATEGPGPSGQVQVGSW